VVINRINTLKNLKIYNKDYKLVYSGKMYDIYTKS